MDTRTAPTGLPNGPQYPAGVGPMGVDLSALADLPQGLRGRAIAALDALQDAIRLNDPDKSAAATTELTAIIGEIQGVKASQDTTKLFGGARVNGTRDVMRKFAERAGVRAA